MKIGRAQENVGADMSWASADTATPQANKLYGEEMGSVGWFADRKRLAPLIIYVPTKTMSTMRSSVSGWIILIYYLFSGREASFTESNFEFEKQDKFFSNIRRYMRTMYEVVHCDRELPSVITVHNPFLGRACRHVK